MCVDPHLCMVSTGREADAPQGQPDGSARRRYDVRLSPSAWPTVAEIDDAVRMIDLRIGHGRAHKPVVPDQETLQFREHLIQIECDPLNRPCLDCGALTKGTRCPPCTRAMSNARGSTAQRGYGGAHQAARAALLATLPAPCGYGCGATLTPSTPWVAAHVVDGDAQAGWMASCIVCNERAKRR